ncbi:REP element-mobilizing transposase RayT [Anaerovirgula multivorans]|uniref:REP element-mobilizing transposase RayT n=1 Tax=Anaerovirgula multivorans TaxID=312168 RepID=A0A239KH65_9FIRM|nr:transposase [Anaerovirgula multivorans]SNT17697.1 REP element-mobilizing transposase RayT [Anaerovirgula multivorans]
MPRKAREKSESGIYHIMLRGINRQTIFEEDEDNRKFLQTLEQYKDKCGYKIYGYCLMGNHAHLLLKIGEEPLEQVMRRICGNYVYWYNWKYQRIGNLFQDRFKSEPVEDDVYLLTAQRYIHQNPVKAGIIKAIEKYKWSSYHEYLGEVKLVNVDFILKLLSTDKEKAIKRFIEYNNELNNDICLDINENKRMIDQEAREIIRKVCNIDNTIELQHFDISIRDRYLKELKEEYRLSIRQIERLTGLNRGVVQRA